MRIVNGSLINWHFQVLSRRWGGKEKEKPVYAQVEANNKLPLPCTLAHLEKSTPAKYDALLSMYAYSSSS